MVLEKKLQFTFGKSSFANELLASQSLTKNNEKKMTMNKIHSYIRMDG